jgi:tetratricopeptide (TPR) repeat protein
MSVVLGASCLGQMAGQGPCSDAKPGAGEDRYDAGSRHLQLAEEAFDSGRLAEGSRHVSEAILLADAEPADAGLLIGALRIQGAMYVERGMLSDALVLIERLRAMPAALPERKAIVQGLAGACHHAAGDAPAAEREYVQAIHEWDSIHRGEDSVSDRSNLGVLYLASRRFDEAIVVLERAHALLAVSGKKSAYHRLVVTNNLAVAYSQRGDTAQSVRYAREAVRLADAERAGRYPLSASVYFNSAGVLRAAGHKREANDIEHRATRAEAMANSLIDVASLAAGKN